jgi:cob(I)alamin adenosyltransferase
VLTRTERQAIRQYYHVGGDDHAAVVHICRTHRIRR